jgi:hypothetical protein
VAPRILRSHFDSCQPGAICYNSEMERSPKQDLACASTKRVHFVRSPLGRTVGKIALALAVCFLVASLALRNASAGPDVSRPDAPAPKAASNIVLTNVNCEFLPNSGSCVLSSYAIVANYFTGEPINSYFEG